METPIYIIVIAVSIMIVFAIGWIKSINDYNSLFKLNLKEKQLNIDLNEKSEKEEQKIFSLMIEVQQLSRKPTFKELTEFKQRCAEIYNETETT